MPERAEHDAAGPDASARAKRRLGARVRHVAAALSAALNAALRDNPILIRELRARMRANRAFHLLFAWVFLLAGCVALLYHQHTARAAELAQGLPGATAAASSEIRELGQTMYRFLFVFQAIFVVLVAPALTSGAVTLEREQRTYELAATSPLRPFQMICGKLAGALAFLFLLLTVSLPLVSLCFFVGGVSPAEIVCSYLLVALAAFLYGAIGLYWSAALRTTAAAATATYLSVAALFLATLVWGQVAVFAGANGPRSEIPLRSLNPAFAPFFAVSPEYLFTATVPSWIGSAVVQLLAGAFLALAAMGRLELFEPPLRAVWSRVAATLLWTAAGLFLFGAFLGATMRSWPPSMPLDAAISGIGLAMFFAVVAVAPLLGTADAGPRAEDRTPGGYLRSLLPQRMLTGGLGSALPLLLFWTLLLFAWIPIGAALAGRLSLLGPERLLPPALVVTLAVAAGLAGIGNALTVLLPSRGSACLATYGVAALLLLFPHALLSWWSPLDAMRAPLPLRQLLYFTPHGLYQQASGAAPEPGLLVLDGLAPPWVVTALLYLALAAAGVALTHRRLASVSTGQRR